MRVTYAASTADGTLPFSTRSYEDRLDTISNVREAGISVCCGGILGLGEVRERASVIRHPMCGALRTGSS